MNFRTRIMYRLFIPSLGFGFLFATFLWRCRWLLIVRKFYANSSHSDHFFKKMAVHLSRDLISQNDRRQVKVTDKWPNWPVQSIHMLWNSWQSPRKTRVVAESKWRVIISAVLSFIACSFFEYFLGFFTFRPWKTKYTFNILFLWWCCWYRLHRYSWF